MGIAEAMIIGVIIVAWIGAACVALIWLIDFDCDYVKAAFGALFFVTSIGFFVYAVDKDKRPCLKYETMMMFNAATKTMMPVRHCVHYGEWVEEAK